MLKGNATHVRKETFGYEKLVFPHAMEENNPMEV